MELCANWSGDGDFCPCAAFGLECGMPRRPPATTSDLDAAIRAEFEKPFWRLTEQTSSGAAKAMAAIRAVLDVCAEAEKLEDRRKWGAPTPLAIRRVIADKLGVEVPRG